MALPTTKISAGVGPALLAVLMGLILATSAARGQPCAAQGLGLSVTGERLGDPWSIELLGPPGATGLLGLDLAPGPVATPFGALCLGLSPAVLLLPVGLDGLGALAIGGVLPADPGLGGLTLFFQAAVADTSQPGGIALSNGVETGLLPPRWFLLDPGIASPVGITPGSIASFDALSDVAGFAATLPNAARSLARVPATRLLAVLMLDGSIIAIDDETGATVATLAAPPGPGLPSRIAVTEDGSGIILLYTGTPPSPFSPGAPGALVFIDLPSGSVLSSLSLASGNPTEMMLIPGTGFVYLRAGSDLIPFDYVTGTQLNPIALGSTNGGVVDWLLQGSLLVTLLGGVPPNPFGGTGTPAAIHAADVSNHTAALGAPVPLGQSGATTLRFGPGPAGPAYYVVFPATGSIARLLPGLFTTAATVSATVGTALLELSAGGSEWLLVRPGGASPFTTATAGVLLRMDPATSTLTTLATLPTEAQQLLLPLPSGTLRKAHLISGTASMLTIATDPAIAPGPAVSLPITSAAFQVIGDW
ncbi:MAG: hypothetical protein CMJ83_18885 [Planctomycetes bacterium]|nr:hypothetical protein [Planctomycetota bacterium]